MRAPKPLLAVVCTMALATGCTSGSIYRRTIEPLDVNLNATPAHQREGNRGAVRHLSIPIPGSGTRVDVLWDSNAIGDVARRHGMEKVYYADLETLNILTVWRMFTVHVYGE